MYIADTASLDNRPYWYPLRKHIATAGSPSASSTYSAPGNNPSYTGHKSDNHSAGPGGNSGLGGGGGSGGASNRSGGQFGPINQGGGGGGGAGSKPRRHNNKGDVVANTAAPPESNAPPLHIRTASHNKQKHQPALQPKLGLHENTKHQNGNFIRDGPDKGKIENWVSTSLVGYIALRCYFT